MKTAHCTKRNPDTAKLFAKSGIYAYDAQHSAGLPVTVDPQTGSLMVEPRGRSRESIPLPMRRCFER
jgi:hypothetical protein